MEDNLKVKVDVAFAQSQLALFVLQALVQTGFDQGDLRLLKLANVLEKSLDELKSATIGPDTAPEARRAFEDMSGQLLNVLHKRSNP